VASTPFPSDIKLNEWMKYVKTMPLREVLIPGTHDSATNAKDLYESMFGFEDFALAQELSIYE
jgi:hypothetical protein